MTVDDRLRAELDALERAAPADLPPIPAETRSPRWRRLALPAAVMVIAGTLIGLSVPNWLPGGLPFGSRVGDLVPVPTGPNPAPSGQPVLCQQALMAGTLVRDPVHGFVVASGDHRTPVRWPNGYVGREGAEGLELLNEAGQVVAREGDYVEMGGGQGGEMWIACPGPEVIPPEFTGRLEGDADMEDGCIWLRPDSGRRWPIAWPDGYREEFRGGEPVLLRNGEVVARAGDQVTVRGAPGDMGYACIGFSSYVATEVVGTSSSQPDEPSPAPSDEVVEIGRIRATLPAGWDVRLPDNPPFGAPHIVASWDYFWISNQPMRSDCEQTPQGTMCSTDHVVPQLRPGGVLMWWDVTTFMTPNPDRTLPPGTPTTVGGYPAVVREEGCEGRQHADFASSVQVRVGDSTTVRVITCGRDVGEEELRDIDRILESVSFDQSLTSPTPGDDDPE